MPASNIPKLRRNGAYVHTDPLAMALHFNQNKPDKIIQNFQEISRNDDRGWRELTPTSYYQEDIENLTREKMKSIVEDTLQRVGLNITDSKVEEKNGVTCMKVKAEPAVDDPGYAIERPLDDATLPA